MTARTMDLRRYVEERVAATIGEVPPELQRALRLQTAKDFKFGDVALP